LRDDRTRTRADERVEQGATAILCMEYERVNWQFDSLNCLPATAGHPYLPEAIRGPPIMGGEPRYLTLSGMGIFDRTDFSLDPPNLTELGTQVAPGPYF
jgi:hypothetical protein